MPALPVRQRIFIDLTCLQIESVGTHPFQAASKATLFCRMERLSFFNFFRMPPDPFDGRVACLVQIGPFRSKRAFLSGLGPRFFFFWRLQKLASFAGKAPCILSGQTLQESFSESLHAPRRFRPGSWMWRCTNSWCESLSTRS